MKLLILTQKIDKNDDVLGFFHDWVIEFAKHCEKVTVIALSVGEYDLPRNVKVLSLGKELSSQMSESLPAGRQVHKVESKKKYLFNFYRYIWSEKNNYDNVFVHMNPEYVILGGLFWRIMGKKIGLWYMHKSVDFKLRVAEKLTHTIFSGTRESFRLKTKKLNITGHGIPSQKFIKSKSLPAGRQVRKANEEFKMITVGRISPIKDYETLINAIKILKIKNQNVNLDIIGEIGLPDQDDYLSKLKQKIKDESLEENINFMGSVSHKDIVNHLNQADLFVNMSQTGSLDKVILEAMACEIITISSNDSSRNVFEEYKDKLFFKSKDSEDLAKKVSKIIELSDGDRIKIEKRLREIVIRNHNLEDLIKKIISIYQKI